MNTEGKLSSGMVPVKKTQNQELSPGNIHTTLFILSWHSWMHTYWQRAQNEPVSSLTTPQLQHIETCTIWRHKTVQTVQDSYIPMLVTLIYLWNCCWYRFTLPPIFFLVFKAVFKSIITSWSIVMSQTEKSHQQFQALHFLKPNPRHTTIYNISSYLCKHLLIGGQKVLAIFLDRILPRKKICSQ